MDEREKANRVLAILTDSVFQEAVEKAKEVILSRWYATDPDDYQTRETLWMRVRGIDDVIRELRAVADRQSVAEKREERKRIWNRA